MSVVENKGEIAALCFATLAMIWVSAIASVVVMGGLLRRQPIVLSVMQKSNLMIDES